MLFLILIVVAVALIIASAVNPQKVPLWVGLLVLALALLVSSLTGHRFA